MSSDIFSRNIDVSKFDLIYAGAQKNMGPAGTTLVVIKDNILGKTGRTIPTMLDYNIHIKKESDSRKVPVSVNQGSNIDVFTLNTHHNMFLQYSVNQCVYTGTC